MRVVQVLSGYLPQETSGTQIHVRDLCRGLRARGHEVEVFTRLAGDEHGELEVSRDEWEGVRVTRVTNNFADLDRFERIYTHPVIDARFDELLAETRPDLVHVHHLTCLSTSMIDVARRRGLPVVMGLHDYWMVCLRGQRVHPEGLEICHELDRERCAKCLNLLWPHLLPLGRSSGMLDRLFRRPPARRKLDEWERHVRRMLNACAILTAPSRFHRDRFVEWGVDPAQIVVAPYGLDVPSCAAPTREMRPPRNIGFIGTVIPSKGVHVLCEAFGRLDRSDLVLHVHGEASSFHGDRTYVERLRSLVRPDLAVRFHGRYEHDELPSILSSLDVLVVPSLWWESFSIVAREGALAGVPVVASRLGGLEQAIDDGIALGFRAGDAKDLAAVLGRLLSDPELRAAMSRRAERVRTLGAAVSEMVEIYERALGLPARRADDAGS